MYKTKIIINPQGCYINALKNKTKCMLTMLELKNLRFFYLQQVFYLQLSNYINKPKWNKNNRRNDIME